MNFRDKNKIIDVIKNQTGSNGQKGWPIAARDRVAYPSFSESILTDANIGVAFLWTMRDSVIPKLEKNNLAIAANFYTPAGIQPMVRNVLGNPFIRYFILLGEEYSSRSQGERAPELTSANAIREFFKNGINKDRKLSGFESALYFDKNIPSELIEKIRENIEFIDLNEKMPQATFHEKIAEANKLIKTLPKKDAFAAPLVFDYEKTAENFPYEGGPLIVHGTNIPNAWIKMVDNIFRYGKNNLMNANTDRLVKEINDMVVVVHDSQNMDLSLNPFLIPLTKEKIEAYKKKFCLLYCRKAKRILTEIN